MREMVVNNPCLPRAPRLQNEVFEKNYYSCSNLRPIEVELLYIIWSDYGEKPIDS